MLLQDYRNSLKLSREKAGKALGVSGITVWRWETGRSMPEKPQLQKIAKWSKGKVTANDMLAVAA